MGNRNKAIAMAAAQLQAQYDRLPTVHEVSDETKCSFQQIYDSASYKDDKIAKKSAKLTTEMTGSSVTESEQFKNDSIEHTRANRLSKSDQFLRDGLIDESKADDANDEKQHERYLHSKKKD